MRYFVGALRLIGIGVLIAVILGILFFVFPFSKQASRGRWVKRLSRSLMSVFGVRVSVKGAVPEAEVAETGVNTKALGYMVCANHISFVDIFVLNIALPCRFVAKKEIASWPVFGYISRAVGTIFIDRSRRRAVLEIADAMSGVLKEGGNVLFFPEGTTGGGRTLLPFHANLFEAAVRSGARVLPITLRYTMRGETTELVSYAGEISLFTVLKRIIFTPQLGVEVSILDPIASLGCSRHQLCAETSSRMSAALGVPDATAEREEARRQRLSVVNQKSEAT